MFTTKYMKTQPKAAKRVKKYAEGGRVEAEGSTGKGALNPLDLDNLTEGGSSGQGNDIYTPRTPHRELNDKNRYDDGATPRSSGKRTPR